MKRAMSARAAQAAAKRGAALLDTVRKGWFWNIRVTDLDLASSCNCILGQLSKNKPWDYGSYARGAEKVLGWQVSGPERETPDAAKAERYGFFRRMHRKQDVDYPLLTQAWANEVRIRRGFKPVDLTNPRNGRLALQVAV